MRRAQRVLLALAAAAHPACRRAHEPRIVRAFVGSTAACMLLADGSTRCRVAGPCLVASDPACGAPTAPSLQNASEIVFGRAHACARIAREVRCWGVAGRGQSGAAAGATREHPATVVRDAIRVAAGGDASCAVRASGTVVCWGDLAWVDPAGGARAARASIEPVPVPEVSAAVDVALGDGFGCARSRDGSVRCWGTNDCGQLGRPVGTGSAAAVVPGLARAVQLVAAGGRACIRGADAAVYCWGNVAAAASCGSPDARGVREDFVPRRVSGLTNVAEIRLGDDLAAVLHRDGSVSVWGDTSAAFRTREARTLSAPTRIPGATDVRGLAAGGGGLVLVMADGRALAWGLTPWNPGSCFGGDCTRLAPVVLTR